MQYFLWNKGHHAAYLHAREKKQPEMMSKRQIVDL